jgi:hypothetical protein
VVATARLDGTISGVQSAARFTLAGLQVDAGGAVFTGGTAASLRNGLRVRVTGAAAGGRIQARTVEIRDDEGSGSDDGEVRGTIVRVGGVADFTVRDTAGRLVVVSAALARFDDGTSSADLRVGVRVEVRGRLGTVLLASRIRIDR